MKALIFLALMLLAACASGKENMTQIGGGRIGTGQQCICYESYQPVCGSDGQTYSNDCFAQCAGVGFSPGTC